MVFRPAFFFADRWAGGKHSPDQVFERQSQFCEPKCITAITEFGRFHALAAEHQFVRHFTKREARGE
jgi:hypothetical protein